jgi:hypothetical protein
MPRRKISQREAVRQRRQLRRLTEFVVAVRDRTYEGTEMATLEIGEQLRGVFKGLGIAGGFIVVGRRDGNYLKLRACRVPEGIA